MRGRAQIKAVEMGESIERHCTTITITVTMEERVNAGPPPRYGYVNTEVAPNITLTDIDMDPRPPLRRIAPESTAMALMRAAWAVANWEQDGR